MKRALSTVSFLTAATAFVSLPFSDAHAEDYEVIDDDIAGELGGATGGDEIRLIDNGTHVYEVIHLFTSTNTATLTIPDKARIVPGTVKMLMVGGGGSGGANCGGGGGAGGLVYKDDLDLEPGSATIVVGGGGAGVSGNVDGRSGANTTFALADTTYTALGGGGGSHYRNYAGTAGGSGGGGSGSGAGGATQQATSTTGGFGFVGGRGTGENRGGGGGGAGGAGGAASGNTCGAGGAGLSYDISGEEVIYAAGGGGAGAGASHTGGAGGSSGVGGKGAAGSSADRNGAAGATNTGSGGGGGAGGSYSGTGGAGGSGIVIVRYTLSQLSTVEIGGATITYSPAATNWVDGELVLTYTNTDRPGLLSLPRYTQVRALLVGGGGAGANPAAAGATRGGAGGGGAGGFLDVASHGLLAGDYNVVVGIGGVAQAANVQSSGANGENSSITLSGETEAALCALGGGGGGMLAAGLSGGSGGGGSKSQSGGTATQPSSTWGGDGNAGGSCAAVNRAGGGGGGAGAAGSRATTLNVGGNGGAGKVSDITGMELYYAGGGGGGSRNGTGGTGGEGGGGTGGGSAGDATSGADGFGGGGGGGSLNKAGGNGGSGVVIIRIKVVMPEKPTTPDPIVYDGQEHVIYPEGEAYTLTGTPAATSVGEYSFTATLNAGYLWADGTTDAVTINWSITKPKLVVTSFEQVGWQIGEQPNDPTLVVTAGVGGPEVTLTDDQVVYQYSDSESGPWTTTVPSTVGTWYVQAEVTGGADFDAPETKPVASFQLWEAEVSPITTAAYHALLTVGTSYDGAALTNFPMLVRVKNNQPLGFRYDQAFSDGSDLRFYAVDSTGAIVLTDGEPTPLAYQIESWNPDGETIIWVKVPRYESGPVAMMTWAPVEGRDLPATPAATEVWSSFAGVWHMTETIEADAAEKAKSLDSTVNENHATPMKGTATTADYRQMVSTNGIVGNARVNSSTESVQSGTRLLTAKATTLGSTFTFSGWYRMFASGQYPRMAGSKQANNAPGWSVETVGGSSTRLVVRGNATSSVNYGADNDDMVADWVFLTFVFEGTSSKLYSNGELVADVTIPAVVNTTLPLAFGSNSNGNEYSLNGAYDELRLMGVALSDDWIKADYLQMREGAATFGPAILTPDSLLKNYWRVEPTISATEWGTGEEPAISAGEPAYGAPSYFVITAVTGETLTNDFPTAAGAYTLIFRADGGTTKPDGTWSWASLETDPLTVNITAHSPRTDLSGTAGTATLSGRVLLANNEPGTTNPILDQDYDQTADSSPAIYWIHSGDDAAEATFPNLKSGSEHWLVAGSSLDELCGATNIWHLTDVFLGTTYNGNLGSRFTVAYNRLPFSPTSAAGDAQAVHLVMRNLETAAVVSPCYTNGIGTIYFDAVNGWTTEAGTGYNLALEVVTGEAAMAEAIDESAWTPVTMTPLLRDTTLGADFIQMDATEVLALGVTNGQNSVENFYRVYATVEQHEPTRFRIRRASIPEDFATDAGGFILLDNIVVSYPPMRADLETYGWYDAEKGGKQTLGFENAWNVPFPSITDTVNARAKVSFYTNPGDLTADTNSFITAATMHYRWRYLEQKVSSWKTIALDPSTLTAPSALDLKQDGVSDVLPGDVEFWYDLIVNAPYYKYVDYAAVDGFRMSDFYSEEKMMITNRAEGVTMSSLGTDWFVRLREGQSNFEAFNIEVWTPDEDGVFAETTTTNDLGVAVNSPAGVSVVEMELIDDHVWRGYLKTLDAVSAGVRFRVKALNEQVPGSTTWATNEVVLALGEDATEMPVSAILQAGSDTSWSALPIDASTGYLMFQIDDQTRSVTIVHADYQNFNSWNDANKGGELFTGSMTEDNGKSGTSPRANEYIEGFEGWIDMPATNAHWQESFTTTTQLEYDDYTTFSSATTPNGWTAGQGMFVYGNYRDNRTGRALQMEGQGRGYLQFVDAEEAPRGLESVSFRARLGQFINFSDFCYYDGESKSSMSNYTFVTRAAFDTNNAGSFKGNASLSLIAYYRPNKGCYEFRFEQVRGGGTVTVNGASTLDRRGQRFSLYRWAYDQSTGRMVRTLLGSRDSSALNNFEMARTSSTEYLPMYLSVWTENGVTCIMAGVRRSNMTASAALSRFGGSNGNFASIVYRDTTDDRLKAGTYGVLSANCDGRFVQMYQLTKPTSFLTNFTTPNTLGQYSNNAITFETASPHECLADLDPDGNDSWYVTPGRMAVSTDTTTWGLQSNPLTQTVNIYTGSAGKTDWTLLASTNFNSFGTSQACTFPLYTTDDCSVKIAVAGDLDDLRTDLIIDDVELKQWRGDSWYNEDEIFHYIPNWTSEQNIRAHTNFIFTSAWIKDEGLLLSAKRTAEGEPCSIRSPLFDGSYGRGVGLGMFSFSYKDAQPETVLQLQIATNVTYDTINLINNLDEASWTTVTNFTFTADQTSGTRSCYLGLHGVKGVMRLLVDPTVVTAAKSSDNPNYGEILITDVYCRDEPLLDSSCWWGWNLRTLGADVLTGGDSEGRMYLPDVTTQASKIGMSLALNNSVTENTDVTDGQTYIQHPPFVQTPTFTSNVVGEVTFRARKYDASETSQPAQVTLYGSTSGADSSTWKRLEAFIVSNTTYATYAFKTEPNESYNAFRLAVTGVSGVTDTTMDNRSPEGYDEPVRVLIDEVLVSEAVRARVAFKNVGPFRTDLSGRGYVSGVPSEEQQPLCNEAWGIQCEVYAAQLPDEVDFSRTPQVRVHWYQGSAPWGFNNWRTRSSAKSAWLAPATGTNLVYRSSYVTASDAIMPAVAASGMVVQYMLEVIYYQVGSSTPVTNYLSAVDWENPSWYKPVDHNAGQDEFSAYTILDTVAPHWAWINELNIYGEYDSQYYNTDKEKQFIEIAVPAEADITGWRVESLEPNASSGTVVTNTLGIFGNLELTPMKENLTGMASNMVFRVLANNASKTSGNLKTDDGTLDAVWNVQNPTYDFPSSGEMSAMAPFGFRLVRASGVVEHEIVAMGTNWWAGSIYGSLDQDPTNVVTMLNQLMPNADFLYVGDDDGGVSASLGVVNERGGTSNVWSKVMSHTPGRINEGQNIDPDHPTPNGSSIIIYANLDQSVGPIYQTLGDAVNTNGSQILVIQKGSARGTNITYRVDPWFQLGTVTTNGRPATATALAEPRTYVVNVGAGASNNVTVVASAEVKESLIDLGLTPDNKYRSAIIDWLKKHKDAYGNDWANPDVDEVRLADFISLHGNIITNMTLTEMYWLDMDPTVGNLALKAGMSAAPTPSIVDGYLGGASMTNVKMGVFMQITNRVEDTASPYYGAAWAPYIIRGMEPGGSSWDYDPDVNDWRWTNATFKITGILANGLTRESNARNWIPLRWFVFREDSFDENFTTRIEVKDPFSTESPGYGAGWYDWVREHGATPVFFRWGLDERIQPFGVEILEKENYYE